MIKWDGEAEKMSRQFSLMKRNPPHIFTDNEGKNNKKNKMEKNPHSLNMAMYSFEYL